MIAPWWRRFVAWLQGNAPISRFHVGPDKHRVDVITEAVVDPPTDRQLMARRMVFAAVIATSDGSYSRPAPTTMPGEGERFSQ